MTVSGPDFQKDWFCSERKLQTGKKPIWIRLNKDILNCTNVEGDSFRKILDFRRTYSQ